MVMAPVIGAEANGTPKGVLPHVDVKLKSGWRYNGSTGNFCTPGGEIFSPGKQLPKGTKIVATVPALAQADPKSLSEHELNLAHYVQIIFSKRSKPASYLEQIANWPSVETARPAPAISLP